MGTLASGFRTHVFQCGFNTQRNHRTNGLKHPVFLKNSFRFRFFIDNSDLDNKKKFGVIRTHITFVVINGSESLSLRGNDSDDEDDDDFAAEEYDEVEAFYDSDDEKEEDEELAVASERTEYSRKDKFELVVEFCAKVQEDRSFNISATQLASIYDFPLDKFQWLAIESFLNGSSVVVCTPTSSGKTLIAEAAALATIAKGKRLLYTAPLKALSNQKFREFKETFGENNVGLLTGDAAVNREAPILIMTTEILRNMLYQSVNTVSEGSGLEQVDFIILDEVHYLSDISRGTVWEETIIYCPKEVQLICLSATISNPEELAGWIAQVHGPTDLVMSKRRPVPLTWHFSRKKSLSPLLNQKATNMNRSLSITRFLQKNSLSLYDDGTKRNKGRKAEKRMYHNGSASHGDISELSEEERKTIRRSQVPLVIDTLMHLRTRDMLPAIWFMFSRKGCDDAVEYLEASGLLNDKEKLKVYSALEEFRAQYPEAVRENSVTCLLQGVAAHHAGCLPLWKSFIEELFQQGLIKVVFATETLAAGINMPARTTVLSSVSKRGDNGHSLLSSNALLQMAGRAGRRGIDKEGHVVVVQTPFEGAEECCKLLFAGPDPLVSQFSASYGMVLNLLAARRLTLNDQHPNGSNVICRRRTLEEARALIEKSFGNYVSSEVMIAAKDQLDKMESEIEKLQLETSDETLYEKIKAKLSKEESSNFFVLVEQLKAMRLERIRAHKQLEHVKVSTLKPLLEESSQGQIHFICLEYKDKNKEKHLVPALFVGKINKSSFIGLESKIEEWYPNNGGIDQYGEAAIDEMAISDSSNGSEGQDIVVSYYVALGSDNTWYLFTERWIKAVYKSGLPNVPLTPGDPPSREILKKKLEEVDTAWEKVAKSKYGDVWRAEGAIDTWSWSLNVPLLHNLSSEDEIAKPKAFIEAQRIYRESKKFINSFQRRLRSTQWYKEFQRLSDLNLVQKEKIEHLKAKASRIKARISQIEPTGWRDFLQVAEVLHEANALDINTQLLYPLGETASKIRGGNELWLAMAIRNECLIGLKPSQLAAVCGSLVSEGIKVRPSKNSYKPNADEGTSLSYSKLFLSVCLGGLIVNHQMISTERLIIRQLRLLLEYPYDEFRRVYVYEVSNITGNAIEILEEQRSSLLQLQTKHKVEISCDLDMQFAGIVEAWASGLTWREIMLDCGVDDGDLARLLRRTIDFLSQIPLLPDVDRTVQKSAKQAAHMMDRTPISELVG